MRCLLHFFMENEDPPLDDQAIFGRLDDASSARIAQTIKARAPRDRYMIGRGGVGLVMYHLAKRRIEFALTPDTSPLGDVWIDVAGTKAGVEVKTSRRGEAWHIKLRQIGAAEFYVLVCLDDATCYVLTSSEMKTAATLCRSIYEGIAALSSRDIPREAIDGWHKLSGTDAPKRKKRRSYSATGKKPRRVTRTLADGRVVVYQYPPFRHAEKSENGQNAANT